MGSPILISGLFLKETLKPQAKYLWIWPEMTSLVTPQQCLAAGKGDSALARASGGLEVVTPNHTCIWFFKVEAAQLVSSL